MGNSLKKTGAVRDLMEKAEGYTLVRAIRGGLLSITPVLIIGAFALILKTFPVEAYQKFVNGFAGGLLLQFLDFVYNATFGILSLYMTVAISRSYMRVKNAEKLNEDTPAIGAMLSSMLSFTILAGTFREITEAGTNDKFNIAFVTNGLGPQAMFLAILTGIGAAALYARFYRLLHGRRRRFYSTGADHDFNLMLSYLFPITLTAAVFAVFNTAIVNIFSVHSFRELLASAFNNLFSIGGSGFFKGFFFVMLSSVLWFFGIHGSDTLEGVMQQYFAPGLAANQAAAAAGNAPTEILTKQFFDCFVLMGGCGSAICLLIAILLFSKNRARRGLGWSAAFPMLFNINELMVFGLPVVFNPIMLIPFITVPLVCYSTAYVAIATGLVPMITGSVEWTTPILLGGFHATGSVAGSLLQVANVVLGVLIYVPFVRMLDKRDADKYKREYDSFLEYFRQNEQSLANASILEQKSVYGDFARALCAEIKHGMKKGVVLAYQPQYGYDGRCIGVEALLRWHHPNYGMLYPPMVIKLAQEGGYLPDMEEAVVLRALEDRPKIIERFGKDVKISVNVTGTTIVTPRYMQFMQRLAAKESFEGKNFCLELTEQAALSFDEETINTLHAFRDLGLLLAIDDFSMGQTSINYLKESLFDFIKLDGSLVKGLFTHKNCREIILSITQLAASLSLTVLAEYVETAEEREALHEIGCDCYQGYLYSPAVFLSEPAKPQAQERKE